MKKIKSLVTLLLLSGLSYAHAEDDKIPQYKSVLMQCNALAQMNNFTKSTSAEVPIGVLVDSKFNQSQKIKLSQDIVPANIVFRVKPHSSHQYGNTIVVEIEDLRTRLKAVGSGSGPYGTQTTASVSLRATDQTKNSFSLTCFIVVDPDDK